ncbi:MAG: hypothetical protein RIA09_16300 [Hoeflea sp.]|jgi:hypothetical protein|uniref:hypothetical protein n=1 Tax=Hoeflea sp. TaxID=1940281 RepID=UPI0032EADFC4
MTKDCIEKVVITRLSGVEAHMDEAFGKCRVTLEFEVPNPNDIYQVVIDYEPEKIVDKEQLRELFENYKVAISPISHSVWDESVAFLLAND